jgi:hypothetical protein
MIRWCLEVAAMTREQALKKLDRLYGKGKGYARVLNIVTTPEMRAESLAELRALRAERQALEAELQAWLDAQPFYQQKVAERKRITRDIREVEGRGGLNAYRFTIGQNKGWCNEITGQGDTWEEAFSEAEKKLVKAS